MSENKKRIEREILSGSATEMMMAQVRLDKANAIADQTSVVLAEALENVLESLAAVTAGSPWLEPFTCFYCGSHRPLHEDSCPYVKARYILEEYENG